MAVASLFSLLSATSSVRRIRLDSAPTSASALAVPYWWTSYPAGSPLVEKVPDCSGEPVLAALCHVLSEEDPSGQRPNISLSIGGTLLVDELPCWLPIGGEGT